MAVPGADEIPGTVTILPFGSCLWKFKMNKGAGGRGGRMHGVKFTIKASKGWAAVFIFTIVFIYIYMCVYICMYIFDMFLYLSYTITILSYVCIFVFMCVFADVHADEYSICSPRVPAARALSQNVLENIWNRCPRSQQEGRERSGAPCSQIRQGLHGLPQAKRPHQAGEFRAAEAKAIRVVAWIRCASGCWHQMFLRANMETKLFFLQLVTSVAEHDNSCSQVPARKQRPRTFTR